MDVSILPPEILHCIFLNLTGKDVMECYKVCQRWQDVIDGFSDNFWKKLCIKEHYYTYEDAYRKAKLSWRQLYDSLNSWEDISNTNIKVFNITAGVAVKFQILENSIISTQPIHWNCETSNAIAYHDLDTEQEIYREQFDFDFSDYSENDKILVLNRCDYELVAVSKRTKKRYAFTNAKDLDWRPWLLFEGDLYYQNLRNELCWVRFTDLEKSLYYERRMFKGLQSDTFMQDIIRDKKGDLKILTTDCIYGVKNEELKTLCSTHRPEGFPSKVVRRHGFKLTEADFIPSLTNVSVESMLSYGNVLIIATMGPPALLNIYYNPYGPDDDIDLHDVSPDKIINLEELCELKDKRPPINHTHNFAKLDEARAVDVDDTVKDSIQKPTSSRLCQSQSVGLNKIPSAKDKTFSSLNDIHAPDPTSTDKDKVPEKVKAPVKSRPMSTFGSQVHNTIEEIFRSSMKEEPRSTSVDQIEIVETANGHKLVILYQNSIFVIQLTHNPTKSEKVVKQKVPSNICRVCKKSKTFYRHKNCR